MLNCRQHSHPTYRSIKITIEIISHSDANEQTHICNNFVASRKHAYRHANINDNIAKYQNKPILSFSLSFSLSRWITHILYLFYFVTRKSILHKSRPSPKRHCANMCSRDLILLLQHQSFYYIRTDRQQQQQQKKARI